MVNENTIQKYKKRVIVLIDEYDAPLNHAFRKGFYEAAAAFFGIFYSCALKQDGESTLEKACLMEWSSQRSRNTLGIKQCHSVLFL
jgi:hypothetical protein